MQGKMVQNAVQNAAKCETMCINIRRNSINKTPSSHVFNASKGQNNHQKVGF